MKLKLAMYSGKPVAKLNGCWKQAVIGTIIHTQYAYILHSIKSTTLTIQASFFLTPSYNLKTYGTRFFSMAAPTLHYGMLTVTI